MTYTNEAARIADDIAANEHTPKRSNPSHTYTINVLHMDGWGSKQVSIKFRSRAYTWNGIIKAAGMAIARTLHDDGIEVVSFFHGDNACYEISDATERRIWKATHDALFDIIY